MSIGVYAPDTRTIASEDFAPSDKRFVIGGQDGPKVEIGSHIVVPAATIHMRIGELAADIIRYNDMLETARNSAGLVLITMLNGAQPFAGGLRAALAADQKELQYDTMQIKSYVGSQSGRPKVLKMPGLPLGGRDVVLLEDIIDTGQTLHGTIDLLRERAVASLGVVSLLRKPDVIERPENAAHRDALDGLDYLQVGFDIPNEFVVGYGLDYDGRYRDLPDIYGIET